jgi:hypothetical protein
VAARVPCTQPWPQTERMLAIAAGKVEDLARDPKLLEMLAAELARWAAKRWQSFPAVSDEERSLR